MTIVEERSVWAREHELRGEEGVGRDKSKKFYPERYAYYIGDCRRIAVLYTTYLIKDS